MLGELRRAEKTNMAITKEELQERAQLVRIHEANCQIEHPTDQEIAFRLATMKRLAQDLRYKELRMVAFGPAPAAPTAAQQRPAAAAPAGKTK